MPTALDEQSTKIMENAEKLHLTVNRGSDIILSQISETMLGTLKDEIIVDQYTFYHLKHGVAPGETL